jgi:protein arginine kinase
LENVRGDAWPVDTGDEGRGPSAATLARLLEAVRDLQKLEEAAREQLRKHRRLEVEDKLHRALALCRTARLMGYPELVEHLSLLRLGAQLPASGWHLPESPCPVTPLLLRLAPAHLAARSGEGLAGRQAAALRARLLRAALSA